MKQLHPEKPYDKFTDLEVSIFNMMSRREGRQFVSWILQLCGMGQSAHVAGDPHGSSFYEGSQVVGYGIIDKLKELCPENYLAMLREEIENDGQHNTKQQPNNGTDDNGDIASGVGPAFGFDR